MHKTATLAAAVVLGLAGEAAAAPCAGFTDVDSASSFCASVEWIRNRGVTQGCTSTTVYCPADPVIRLTMAAFMNRLGNALTPVLLRVDASPGAIDLDANAVVCQSTDFLAANYPRQAQVDLTFAAQSPEGLTIAADLVKSTDGGANWQVLTAVGHRGSLPANLWGSVANLATTNLAVGDNVRFGVRVGRASGSADLTDSRCNLRVAIGSRTGAASPF